MSGFYRIFQEQAVHVLELSLPAGLDASEFDKLNTRVLAAVDESPAGGWVIDLGACGYIGSAAIGFLINVRHRVTSAGGRVVLCAISASIESVLRTSSLGRLFDVTATREDAVALLLSRRGKTGRGRRGG